MPSESRGFPRQRWSLLLTLPSVSCNPCWSSSSAVVSLLLLFPPSPAQIQPQRSPGVALKHSWSLLRAWCPRFLPAPLPLRTQRSPPPFPAPLGEVNEGQSLAGRWLHPNSLPGSSPAAPSPFQHRGEAGGALPSSAPRSAPRQQEIPAQRGGRSPATSSPACWEPVLCPLRALFITSPQVGAARGCCEPSSIPPRGFPLPAPSPTWLPGCFSGSPELLVFLSGGFPAFNTIERG